MPLKKIVDIVTGKSKQRKLTAQKDKKFSLTTRDPKMPSSQEEWDWIVSKMQIVEMVDISSDKMTLYISEHFQDFLDLANSNDKLNDKEQLNLLNKYYDAIEKDSNFLFVTSYLTFVDNYPKLKQLYFSDQQGWIKFYNAVRADSIMFCMQVIFSENVQKNYKILFFSEINLAWAKKDYSGNLLHKKLADVV